MEKVGDFLNKKAEKYLDEDSDDSDFVDALEDLAAEAEKNKHTTPVFPGESGDPTCTTENVKTQTKSNEEMSLKNTHLDSKEKSPADEQSFAAKIVEDVIQSAKRIHISESQEFKESGETLAGESDRNNPGACGDLAEENIPGNDEEDKDKEEEDERLIIDEEALKEREETLTDQEKQVHVINGFLLIVITGVQNFRPWAEFRPWGG